MKNMLKHHSINYNTKEIKSLKIYFVSIISLVFLLFIDQYSKYLIIQNFELNDTKPIIKDVFELHYIRNTGAAWGIFKDQQLFFCVSTIFVSILAMLIFVRCVNLNKFKDLQILIIFILSGAFGNLIDRLRFQYVIDFLYFKLIDFPIFNIADCYISVSVTVTILLLLFKYSEEDINLLLNVKQK